MSSLKSKSDSELKKMVDVRYGKYHADLSEILSELHSRFIFYKSPQEIKDKKEFAELTKKMWEKSHPKKRI